MRKTAKNTAHATLRLLCLSLIALSVIFLLSSCNAEPYTEGSGELKIVASSFIPYDFAKQITGGKATLTVLQTDGGDLHDYTPTTAALKALADADIFIYLGGISDKLWLEDAINASQNNNLTQVDLSSLIHGELAEVEGHTHSELCEQNHGHISEHGHGHSADDGHGHTADEHIWTSLRNAVTAVKKITAVCADKDSANAELYNANAAAYITSLTALDAEYTAAVASSHTKTLVFADRFPFIYLIKDYGLCYYAAFSGCGGETDADFETAVRLTEAVEHNGIKHVIVTESSDGKLAKSICDATGAQVLILNSMQSVSRAEIINGVSYIETMRANLAVLKTAII